MQTPVTASSEGLSGKQAYLLLGAPAAVSPDGPKQQVRTWAKMSYVFFNSSTLSPKMHLGILEQKESTSQLDYASQG